MNDLKCFKIDYPLLVNTLASGIILLLTVVFSDYIAATYLSIFIIGENLLFNIYYRPSIYIKYLAYYFMMVAAIAGTTIIEINTFYLIELRTETSFIGSVPLLVFSYWTLFVILSFNEITQTDNLNNRIIGRDYSILIKIGIYLAILAYLYLFIPVCNKPAFLMGVDRFIYSQTRTYLPFTNLLTNLSADLLIFPLLGIFYGFRKSSIVAILLYLMYFLWIGNKFGPFFTALCIIGMVFYDNISAMNPAKIRKLAVSALSILLSLICITWGLAILQSDKDGFGYLEKRLAQQGQLWWKTYEQANVNSYYSDFSNEIKAALNKNLSVQESINARNGIYGIMYFTTPENVVKTKLSSGSRYTESGFATAYYYFGMYGTILYAILMGFVISYTVNAFIKAIRNEDIIKILILVRLFQIERYCVSMFEWTAMFNWVSILSYIILIMLYRKKISFDFSNHRLKLRIDYLR